MEPRGLSVGTPQLFSCVCTNYFCRCVSGHFHEPIRFKVKDKEHTLGSVTVPISGLGNSPNKFWLPLQPHKRASDVHGSLQLSCWITSNGEQSKGNRTRATRQQETGSHYSDNEQEAEKVRDAMPKDTCR